MRTAKNIIGNRYGRWLVISINVSESRRTSWECLCDCGAIGTVRGSALKSGRTQSCGCLHTEGMRDRFTTHGKSKTPIYNIHRSMMNRCYLKTSTAYENYGGRGITVCDRWHSFENFYADMGDKPEGMSIERLDNAVGYSPENCKWATGKEQGNNTRRNRYISYKGVTKTASQWGDHIGITGHSLLKRLRRGWSVEATLATPVMANQHASLVAI